MKKPKAFVLYPNQWEPLSCLSDEQLGRLFRHIFCWLNDESLDIKKEEQLVDSDILLAFRFMRMQINIDIEKYQQLCELNRQKAMKRWEKQTNDAAAFSAMHKKEKEKKNEKEKENEKENEIEKENEKESSSIAAVGISEPVANAEEAAAADSFYEKAEKEWMPWFNRLLDGYESQIPRLRMMTKPRAERLRELLEKYGRDVVAETFRKAAGSQFLNGRGTKNKFIAKFDWIIDEKHFLDILEGNFNG